MRPFLSCLVLVILSGCVGYQRSEIRSLVERQKVEDTVNRLFIATDNKSWEVVTRLFADQVRFDMTSLAGGKPALLSGKEISEIWKEGLKKVLTLHHQSGNLLTYILGDEAEVFCYGTATHYTPKRQKKVTTFVGAYQFHLVKSEAGWRIDKLTFLKKYVD